MEGGELRRVSILFADILNSTAMVQHLDPEAASELLDPPLDAMRDAVDRYDGVVSHLGDGILAVFGAPSACEDHAVRACLAALSIQDAMAGLAPLRARIGIHTGEVVMRERRIGRAQIWEPVGPALSVAARIEQAAQPGTILISAATAEGARGFVATAPLPALAAKGFDAPLDALRLTGAEPGANRWDVRSANGVLGMVDRTEERAALHRFLHGAHPPGVHALQVHGDAGIGKSRLLHEALREAAGDAVFAVRLSGVPHRRDAAFHAFGVWLRGWLDIRAGDGAEAARARLLDRTRRVAGLTEGGRDSLARILGLAAAEPAGRSQGGGATDVTAHAAEAVLAVLRHGADGRRLVLACEDLDCFDAASRDLLSAIAAAAAGRGLLVVTTARTRLRLAGPATAQSLHLQPLEAPDVLELLAQIDRRIVDRPALAAALRDRTGGNPLFVEEMGARAVASLARPDADAPALGAEPAQLPDRVESLIADRLARLPRVQKRLVQLCALIGDTVPLRLLARLAGLDEAEGHRQLLRLQAGQILIETRRYPDPEFAFRHGLMRETAYRAILSLRRRELHRRVVDVLEQDGAALSPNWQDDLCFHAAGAQDWASTARHSRAAAALAAEKSAYQVARLRLDQGLAALEKLPDADRTTEGYARDRLAMLLDKRMLLVTAGRYADATTVLDEAQGLAVRLADRAAAARIVAQRMHLLNIAGRMEEAVALGRAACAEAEASGDPALRVLAAHHLAQAHFNQGDVRACTAVLDGVLGLLGAADKRPRPDSIGSLPVLVHSTRALSLALAGQDRAAQEAADAAQGCAEATGRPYDQAFAALGAGLARLRSAPEDAAEVLLDGIAACETGQIEQAAPPLHAALGHLLLRRGDWAGAASWLGRAYQASLEQTRSMVMCWAASGLAQALWETGDREAAGRLGAEAVEVARRSGYRAYLAIALRLRAGQLGPAEALDALREAETLAAELRLDGEHADCRAALAALRVGSGDG